MRVQDRLTLLAVVVPTVTPVGVLGAVVSPVPGVAVLPVPNSSEYVARASAMSACAQKRW